jgi:GT2 family glycosyltransferase
MKGCAVADISMTIVVPSHQRRVLLRRLLENLHRQIEETPRLGDGLDVVVVIDGSTDGSAEMARSRRMPVPITVLEQPHSGRAAAHNAGLKAASGDLIWFLHDDVLPSDGLVSRHRWNPLRPEGGIVVGPVPMSPDLRWTLPANRWWAAMTSDLRRSPAITRCDYFSIANTSGPTDLFRSVGGFNEVFVGWGGEDFDLGYRLLRGGAQIVFDGDAIAFHDEPRSVAEICANNYEGGRNLVRLLRLHPDAITRGGDARRRLPWLRWLAYATYRSGSMLLGPPRLAAMIQHVARWEDVVGAGRMRAVLKAAMIAHHLAGVVAEDPSRGALRRRFGLD